MKLSAGVSTDLGCQSFSLPILIESIRAQTPLGNLPVALFPTSTPDDPSDATLTQIYGNSGITLGEVDFMIQILNAATHEKITARKRIILFYFLAIMRTLRIYSIMGYIISHVKLGDRTKSIRSLTKTSVRKKLMLIGLTQTLSNEDRQNHKYPQKY